MAGIRYEDHTDSVQEKLRLLQTAWSSGRYDLALSLSESLKDTLTFERQLQGDAAGPQVGADAFAATSDLPPAWAQWSRGWTYYRVISLFETVGIERSGEPVDVPAGFRFDQATDLGREVRVARVDASDGTLREVPCQVYDESRRGAERRCRLAFSADVPAHGQATYLVFHGNPNAERTEYLSDLHVSGEGYGLDISNHHYVARLSRQTGQLERLTSRREHSLELYAGGKGHGEPPDIDWAHDYVDEGSFQKVRMRNWARCPNCEVVKGPLCVRVRRWGFPHSPVHPVFTPSRLHMDVTYVFHAGLPYFVKQGRMDAVKDVQVEAIRDDEWVFSGYSFTDTVWIDGNGRLHEGAVPPDQANNLWGVGFFHRDSRDAFVALWLEHAAQGLDRIQHGGAPTLHYAGHGQLWSRYPVQNIRLNAGASLRQTNAYLLFRYPEQDAAGAIERVRHRLANPLEVRAGELPRVKNAAAVGTLARPGETTETAPLKPGIWDVLREVRDEQFYKVDANVVDMGYVYDVGVRQGVVRVLVTMPHPGRPMYDFLVTKGGGRLEDGIRERLLRLDGVREVIVDFTWDPAWSAARLTDAGRQLMGLPG